ncbi:Putative polysaccharide biosynthesis protein [Desulfonema limicola]|uniref:Polysaccharide biosynthesis protein n=1 Tax=Desulfonema limicola TaxID=45656 RepID=A0A975B5D0_9BACT|nr:oligosaccharide flippase family protein [Desulfonema limicola]QTA79111.1 Putative polysaccharide biosynthesis protein [Desulfonema limicola]
MSLKKEISIAAAANWSGVLCGYLLAFIATPIIVHSFGNERYGLWSIAMSITGYYGILDIGIRTTVIKYFSQYAETKDYRMSNLLFNTVLASYIFIIPILLIIVFILTANVKYIFNISESLIDETKSLLYIISLNFWMAAAGNLFRSIVASLRKFVLQNTINTVYSILRNIFIIAILKLGYGLIATALVVLFIDLMINITYIIFVFKYCSYLEIKRKYIQFKEMKHIYVFAFYDLLRHISGIVLGKTDIILIGIFLNVRLAAFYSIAESLIRYLAQIPKGLRATLLPFSSKLDAHKEYDSLKKMALIMPKYTMSFFMLTYLAAILYGQQFLDLWIGPGYELSYEIMIILIMVKAISMSQSMLTHIVVGMGDNKFFGIIGFIEMFMNIGLSIFLAKIYGIYGIALGSLFTVIITSGILIPVYSIRKLKIKIVEYYLHGIFIPVILCTFLYYFNSIYLKIESFLWLPLVILEFTILSFIFTWKELKIKGRKISFKV